MIYFAVNYEDMTNWAGSTKFSVLAFF